MIPLDMQLEHLTEQSLQSCRTLHDSLSDTDSVELHLITEHGHLITEQNSIHTHWQKNILAMQKPLNHNDEQFAFALHEHAWEFIAGYTISQTAFYPYLCIHTPPRQSYGTRYELEAIIDCYTRNTKKAIVTFQESLHSDTIENIQNSSYERSLLENAKNYSSDATCLAVFDKDGFILHSSGHGTHREELAHTLITQYTTTKKEMRKLSEPPLNISTVTNTKQTRCIGPIPHSNLALGLIMQGKQSYAKSRFLFKTVLHGLHTIQQKTNTLWGEKRIDHIETQRIWNSWFKPPHLSPLGKYMHCNGEGVFHLPHCIKASGTICEKITWYDSRTQAVRKNLTPCAVCHP